MCGDEQDLPHVMCDGWDADTIRDTSRPPNQRAKPSQRDGQSMKRGKSPILLASSSSWWGRETVQRMAKLFPRSSGGPGPFIVDGPRRLDVRRFVPSSPCVSAARLVLELLPCRVRLPQLYVQRPSRLAVPYVFNADRQLSSLDHHHNDSVAG